MRYRTPRVAVLFILAILASCSAPERPDSITIKVIQTSDVHGQLFPFDHINNTPAGGSLARVLSFVNKERANDLQSVILLDNGDILQGQPIVYYSNFEKRNGRHIVSEVMNYMQYDAATVGNHDIEAGQDVYDRVAEGSDFPWLAANIIRKGTDETYFKPYEVIEIQGVRVVVLGLITSMVPEWLPENLWKEMEFREMLPEAEKWMKIIDEKENPDVVIGLFHEGFGTTTDGLSGFPSYGEGSARVASMVPGFDLVLIGHDHRVWNTLIPASDGDSVLIMGPGSHARQVASATIELVFDNTENKYEKSVKGEIVMMEEFDPDANLMEKFADDVEETDRYVSRKIGEFSNSISSKDAMFGSSAFVDIIHVLQLELTGADISFAAPLSFNAEIQQGDIHVADMFNLYRYENYLYTMELTGEEIIGYLEYSYGNWFNHMESENDYLLLYNKDENGNVLVSQNGRYYLSSPSFDFDSAAGLDYTVDVSKPAGSRINVISMTGGGSFDPEETYTVAINSYRGSGGGGHLREGAGIPEQEIEERVLSATERDLRHYITEWIESRQTLNPSPLNNWEVVPADWRRAAMEREEIRLFGE